MENLYGIILQQPLKKPASGIHVIDKIYRWLTRSMVHQMQGVRLDTRVIAWQRSGESSGMNDPLRAPGSILLYYAFHQ